MNTRLKWVLTSVIPIAIFLSPLVLGEIRVWDGIVASVEPDVDAITVGLGISEIALARDSNSSNKSGIFALQTLNARAYQFGDTLSVGVSITNFNMAKLVDIYIGAVHPNGNTITFVTQLDPLTFEVGFLDNPSSFQPLIKNKLIEEASKETFPDFVNYTFTPNESQGKYQFFTALTNPGAFQDGSMDEGDLISLPVASFDLNSVSNIVKKAILPLIYIKGDDPTAHQTVGAAVGVYLNGKRYFIPFGRVDEEGNEADSMTLFQIGSVTKVFTTSLLGALPFENGQPALNFYKSSIGFSIPLAYGIGYGSWQEVITFEQLATFTAGIKPISPTSANKTTQLEFIQFIDEIMEPRVLPADNDYSDSSIGLLGQILISKAGYQDYGSSGAADEWYDQKLFTPLSMNSSGFNMPLGSSASKFYKFNEMTTPRSYEQVLKEPWVPWGTAGRTMSNINDMLNFVMANLGVKTIKGNTVPASLTRGMEQAISIWTNTGGTNQGFAWVNKSFGGQNMVFKDGGLSRGASAYIILCPNLKFGVVGLANTSAFLNNAPPDRVTQALATALRNVMVDFIPFARQ